MPHAPFVFGPAEFGVLILACTIIFAIFGAQAIVRARRKRKD